MAVPVVSATSVTKLDASHRDVVLVAGSHGGLYAAWLAARAGVRAVILNDAGIGFEEAGVAGLAMLGRIGIAAAAVDCMSARIGDGTDMLARGRISRANAPAAALDITAGMACREAAERLRAAAPATKPPPAYAESRFVLAAGPIEVRGVDSVSLAAPEDAGHVLVCGSHGALLGGKPETALGPAARAAVFHDAGIGIDGVGVTRLPALDVRGIAAATVAHTSARIGDARSLWATGVLSRVNATAAAAGAKPGLRVPDFATLFVRR